MDDDSITGLGGDDLLAGDPSLFGAGGDDALSGGPGDDQVFGRSGDDIMDAFNDPAASDVVACGPGNDRAYTDGTDLIVGDCEEIIRGSHPDAWDRSPFQPALLRR